MKTIAFIIFAALTMTACLPALPPGTPPDEYGPIFTPIEQPTYEMPDYSNSSIYTPVYEEFGTRRY